MKITRKFTVRGSEPDLRLWMSPWREKGGISVRLSASETVQGPNGAEHKSYEGKLTMTIQEAFTLIAELNKVILDSFPKDPK